MTAAHAEARIGVLAAPRGAIIAPILFATAVVLLAETLATLDRPTHAVVWGSLALAVYVAGLLILVGAVHGNELGLARWRLGPWMLLWYGVASGLATVTWRQPLIGTPGEITVASVMRALWLVAVAMTAWVTGYFVGPGRPVRNLAARAMGALHRRFTADVRSPAAPWLLFGIGIAASLATAATTGDFGYVGDPSSVASTATGYEQILRELSLCAPLAVAAAALQVYRERRPGSRFTLAFLFVAELAFGEAAGGKLSFVTAVLTVIIPLSSSHRRLPKAALIALALTFLFIVIPFNQAYRNAARSDSATLTPGQAVAAAPGILRQTLTSHTIVTGLPGSIGYLLQRIREIDTPAIIVQRTPGQIGFQRPIELATAPMAGVVPRAIWSSKPIVAPGYRFSQEYFELSPTVYTSSAVTPAGDLYRHGGWVPVLIGMSLLGCGVRLLDDFLDVRANPHAIFLVLLLFPVLVRAEDDWAGFLGGLPATLFIWLFAVALTFRERRRA